MTKRPKLSILVAGLTGLLVLVTIVAILNAGNAKITSSTLVPVTPAAESRLLPVDMPTPTVAWVAAPPDPWVKELFVKEGEIPAGWVTEGTKWYGEREMPSLVVSYRTTPRETGVTLSEQVAFYSTTLLAEQAYSRTLDQYFPPEYIDDWKTIPVLDFPYQAEALKTACLPSKLNGIPFQVCTTVARYEKLIVMTHGNVFEDKWLTMAGYRQMLEAVDRRVTAVLSQHP